MKKQMIVTLDRVWMWFLLKANCWTYRKMQRASGRFHVRRLREELAEYDAAKREVDISRR